MPDLETVDEYDEIPRRNPNKIKVVTQIQRQNSDSIDDSFEKPKSRSATMILSSTSRTFKREEKPQKQEESEGEQSPIRKLRSWTQIFTGIEAIKPKEKKAPVFPKPKGKYCIRPHYLSMY